MKDDEAVILDHPLAPSPRWGRRGIGFWRARPVALTWVALRVQNDHPAGAARAAGRTSPFGGRPGGD